MYLHEAQLRNARTTRTRQTSPGCQHRPAAGVSTIDGESNAERIERLRRQYAEMGEPFDQAKVEACYHVKQHVGDYWAAAEVQQFGNQAGREW